MRLDATTNTFFRELGYEGAEETVAASLPVSAILVSTHGNIVGATIGRPLLRLCRKSVTVTAQYNLFPMQVAQLLPRQWCPHGRKFWLFEMSK